MSAASGHARKAFLIANGVAICISGLAACVNFFVGPFTPAVWLLPLFQLAMTAIVDVLLVAIDRPRLPLPLWVRRAFGKRLFRWLTLCAAGNRRVVVVMFRAFIPIFFLTTSAMTLYAALTGTISRVVRN